MRWRRTHSCTRSASTPRSTLRTRRPTRRPTGSRSSTTQSAGTTPPRRRHRRRRDARRDCRVARADGILWVNAAGNAARSTGAAPTRSVARLSQLCRHRRRHSIVLYAGEEFCGFLKWDAWPTTRQDYDLYLIDDEMGALTSPRTTSRTARCRRPNPSASRTRSARRTHSRSRSTAGRRPPHRASTSSSRSATRSSTRTQTAASSSRRPRRALSPSAPSPGTTTEPYSSVGPTIDGRVKPDLAAPSAVTSPIYVPTVHGTSSAAPHVAGAAALLRAMFPLATPDALQSFLEEEALDLGAAGTDTLFGAGVLLMPASPPLVTTSHLVRADGHRRLHQSRARSRREACRRPTAGSTAPPRRTAR